MSTRWLAAVTVVAQLSVTPGLAQQGSSIELGGFGAYTFFDSSLSFDDGIGAGGWLGFYLLSRLSLEGEASYTTADWNGATISYVPFRARLVYSQPVSGNFAFLLGAGFVHNEYSKDIQGADNGVTGLVGFRLGFAGPLALRVSGAADYILKPANEEDSNLNIGVQAGLSVTLGPLFGRAAGARPSDDACPNTPAGARVDARGCTVLFEEGATRVVLEGVTFESGGTVLTPESGPILDRVAESLIANPTVRFEIAGHTDNTGYRPYNLSLSLGRAVSVRRYLISKGVSGERLLAKGYGPDEPIASNATPEGQAQNWRVELRRLN
jgi:OOP family OmpA-OmpF porin